jgi:predicted nucleic acid-binding protein
MSEAVATSQMKADAFVDTNVVVYAFTRDDPRTAAARSLLAQGPQLNVQVLNEFVNVAVRKLRIPWSEIYDALRILDAFAAPPRPLTFDVHRLGIEIAERHHYRIYDALIIAAAIEAGCRTLYSEDLANGQTIRGVRIVNPFAA